MATKRKQIKIRATNIRTGEVEEMALAEWSRKHAFLRDTVYKCVKNGYKYKEFELEMIGFMDLEPPSSVSKETAKKIVASYKAGKSLTQLESEFPYCQPTIRKVLRDAGYTQALPHPYHINQSHLPVYPDYEITDIGKLKALVNAGWKENEIAYEFNTSVTKVREKMAEI